MINQRVVCAAIKLRNGIVVPSARHFDGVMVKLLREYNINSNGSIQGFVDNKGNFLTRSEALLVANKENQILRNCGGDDKELFSENLY